MRRQCIRNFPTPIRLTDGATKDDFIAARRKHDPRKFASGRCAFKQRLHVRPRVGLCRMGAGSSAKDNEEIARRRKWNSHGIDYGGGRAEDASASLWGCHFAGFLATVPDMHYSKRILGAFALLAFFATAAQAQVPGTVTTTWHATTLLGALGLTVLFGLVGIILAIIGFKLFDLATPFNLEKEICQEKNLAAAILSGAFILGVCYIVATALS